MDNDTIINFIENSSREFLAKIVSIIFKRVFDYQNANTDRTGDGGRDVLLFTRSEHLQSDTAIQLTTQKDGLEKKAVEDAKKAKDRLQITCFFFICTKRLPQTTIQRISFTINSEVGIQATCLSAVELASLIIDNDLVQEFFDIFEINKKISRNVSLVSEKYPTLREITLLTYISFGSERSNLRNEVHDDIIFIVVSRKDGMFREEVIADAIHLCGAPGIYSEIFSGRIDSLLSRGFLVSNERLLKVSPELKEKVLASHNIYQYELELFAQSLSPVFDKNKLTHSEDVLFEIAVLLSKKSIYIFIESIKNLGIDVLSMNLDELKLSERDLEFLLKSKLGVSAGDIPKYVNELNVISSENPLVKKITRGMVYIALEGIDPLQKSKVINARNWNELSLILDASVIIPYICAKLFIPTKGRFSKCSVECIDKLLSFGVDLFVPAVYLEECVSHFILASQYQEELLTEFAHDLSHSSNGFISHYYMLKESGELNSTSLNDYLNNFVDNIPRQQNAASNRKIGSAFRKIFSDYHIQCKEVQGNPKYRREIEEEYSFYINERNFRKDRKVMEHDVQILSFLRSIFTDSSQKSTGCLTWDRSMIGIARKISDCGWIINPIEILDLISCQKKMDKSQIYSLCYEIAHISEIPSSGTARIIDTVVHLASGNLQDHKFRENLKTFRREAEERMMKSGEEIEEQEISIFLQKNTTTEQK
jgi:hypothetical protein